MEEWLLVDRSENEEIRSKLKGLFVVESKKLWEIAFPAMVSRVTLFGIYVVTQAFIGHVGELQLAAYALVQTISVRFAVGLLVGMSSATDTLCGQAYGAKQYHMMGTYLQKSLIINLGTTTLILPVFIYSESIFRLLGQQQDTAKVGGYISLWFIPTLYYMAIHSSLQKYLQTQLKNFIVGLVSTLSFLVHVVLSWTFVTKLDLGIPGAMWAMILSNWLVVIVEIVYILGGWCPHTWNGFTWAAFHDLFPILKLSISSGVMLCLELWYNAVLVLLAGYMNNSTIEISAFSICLNVTAWDFMLCVGFMAAISVRVANELGRGDAKAAKLAIKAALVNSIIIGVILWVICLIFGHEIAYLFTSENEVASTVSELSLLLAFSVLLNSVQPILSGIAVGAGRQSIVAYVNLGCYYLLGLPLGIILAYVAHMQVKGIWLGMLIGVVLQSLVLCYVTWKTNWDDQVKKASDRLNKS